MFYERFQSVFTGSIGILELYTITAANVTLAGWQHVHGTVVT